MNFDDLSASISPLSTAFSAVKAIYAGIQGSMDLGEAIGALPGAFQP